MMNEEQFERHRLAAVARIEKERLLRDQEDMANEELYERKRLFLDKQSRVCIELMYRRVPKFLPHCVTSVQLL